MNFNRIRLEIPLKSICSVSSLYLIFGILFFQILVIVQFDLKRKIYSWLHDQNKMVLAGNQMFSCPRLVLIFSEIILFEFWHRKWEITRCFLSADTDHQDNRFLSLTFNSTILIIVKYDNKDASATCNWYLIQTNH